MTLTVITCTHNRPEAFALAERWVARQIIKPDQWLVLDDSDTPVTCTMGQDYHYWPELKGRGSMVNKMKRALETNLISGDALVIWEDDDWYSADYLEWCLSSLKNFDLIGEAHNLYYNVRHRWWFDHHNKGHASLCATAMRRSVFPALLRECYNPADPFIDSRLWENCRLSKMPFEPAQLGRRRSIGIKAMPGVKGYGSGHDKNSGWAIQDPAGVKLLELLGKDASAYTGFYASPPDRPIIPQDADMPTVDVHIVTYNEEVILPYCLRHYRTFATRIIVHDGGSTDRTLAICKEFGIEVEEWDTNGQINDVLLRELKETAWRGTDSSWVIMADADEFIWFPDGPKAALKAYAALAVAVVKPSGWEMLSDTLPVGMGQIYDEIKKGAPDNRWYGKPIMFSPKRVREIRYTAGAHECMTISHHGVVSQNPVHLSSPPAYLLHYHHIGPVERIGTRYDGNKSRFSDVNKKNGWGWHGDGLQHAKDKRAAIFPKLTKIIP